MTHNWSHPCEVLLRSRLVPDRAGPAPGDGGRPGSGALLGEDGYLTGKDAEAVACDAPTVRAG